jgi:hypothetical protein
VDTGSYLISSNVFSADCIVDSGSYFISNNELSAALWTLVHIS